MVCCISHHLVLQRAEGKMVNPFKLTEEEEAMMSMDWVKPTKKVKKNKSAKLRKGCRCYKRMLC